MSSEFCAASSNGSIVLIFDRLVWRGTDGSLVRRCSPEETIEILSHSSRMLRQGQHLPGAIGAKIVPELAGQGMQDKKLIVLNCNTGPWTAQLALSAADVRAAIKAIRANIGQAVWLRATMAAHRSTNRI